MTTVSQYLANFLYDAGLRHVFMLTGGGSMHLNDAFGKHPGLQNIFNHHEQASAMAADSYARLSRQIPIVNVTTGPGGLNTLNGVFGAYVDSLPMFVVSGQVRFDTTVASTSLPLRQLGDQECDIVNMVKGITKYAVMVTDPQDVKYHLQKALYLSRHCRQGPVWLDIPMNVQGTELDVTALREFYPEEETLSATIMSSGLINDILSRLRAAKRPVILAGSGVRLSGMHAEFLTLIDELKIPVTTAWNAHDVLYDDHPLHCGKPGTIGDRCGNFTVQNADVILVLGCRLNIRQISYNYQSFAKSAYKIMVDVDAAELEKPTLKIDLPVHANLKNFIPALLAAAQTRQHSSAPHTEWVSWCQERKSKYPVVLKDYWNNQDSVNPYCFMQALSRALPEDQIIVTGDGTACVVAFQAMQLKQGQRLYTNSGCASMGYDLPAAIGACVAAGGKSVVCLAGDGSIMQNIQELATIAFHRYPIKIFILNNNGYHSIRQTQQNFFGKAVVGVGPESGLGFPDFAKVAAGFGLPFSRCHNHSEMADNFQAILKEKGPMICEIMLDLTQQFAPKVSSQRLEDGRMVTRPLEDMSPLLGRAELAENMLIEETVL
jgi:acetolactate synthase-1/2/3 large subunit